MTQYIIITKNRYGNWADQVGENEPRSYEECEQDIVSLQELGGEWADAEYHIEEVDENGRSTRGIEIYS